ncbi:methyl-accepting chemotaxis protein [Halopseudomonas phragmitis]|nr:methyl-accepting chemotaxis protein [Halopseudomonas phragmitis]
MGHACALPRRVYCSDESSDQSLIRSAYPAIHAGHHVWWSVAALSVGVLRMFPVALRMTIAARLLLWAGLASILFYSAVALGWYGLKLSRDSLYTAHEERLAAIRQTSEIERLLDYNRRLVLIAFQYDPDGKLSIAHGQALSVYLDEIRANTARIEALREQLKVRDLDETDHLLLARFDEHYGFWSEDLDAMLALLEIEDFGVNGMRVFLQVGAEEGRQASDVLVELRAYQEEKTEADFLLAERRYQLTVSVYIVLAVFGLVVGSAAGVMTLRRLRSGLKIVAGQAKAIASGDLTRQLDVSGNDEIADLMHDFARMRDNLRKLLVAVRDQVSLLGRSSSQMTSLSDGSSRLARHQAEAVSSMSAAVEELSVSIDEVRNHAEATRQTTERAEQASHDSEALIGQMSAEMRDIAGVVASTAEHMQALEKFSEQIGSVIQVINEVAEQTNLLSLNAAIEAARAGDMGRGFAVVAGEVRQLAERTSQSTLEIVETVKQIQHGTRAAAGGMRQSVERVERGVRLAGQASESVAAIRAGTVEVITAVSEIREILNGQSTATREIAQEVEGVASGVHQMSESAADGASAALELERLAVELEQMAQQFRVT